jgi:hypothetical protein
MLKRKPLIHGFELRMRALDRIDLVGKLFAQWQAADIPTDMFARGTYAR